MTVEQINDDEFNQKVLDCCWRFFCIINPAINVDYWKCVKLN